MNQQEPRQPHKPFDVIVVGELNADLILQGDTTPAYGQVEKLIEDANLVLGSSSAIFACGAARLGLRVGFIGKVGDDTLGHFVLDQLRAREVNVEGVLVDKTIKTGLSVILLRQTDRAILTYSGSIGALRFSEINLNHLAQACHLHLGSYFMLDGLRPEVPRLFDAAHERGLSVSIDTNYDPSERWDGGLREALQRADIALPNETELCAITRCEDVPTAAERLHVDVPVLGVKLGAAGALGLDATGLFRAPSLSVTVVDTVGAGDSFDAGFVYGYLQKWPLPRILQIACACGSLSTRASGGTAAQATLDEVMPFVSA